MSREKNNKSSTYVSRAGDKLASVDDILQLDFRNKLVLDVGSSTGGFTDFALRRGARKVIAVELGTDQMHPRISSNERVELHEKTNILDYFPTKIPDIVLMDLSFVSLREILPRIAKISDKSTVIVAMFKPQFEATSSQKNRGVVKNNAIRRELMKDFEAWVKNVFIIEAKSDSGIKGAKGNRERFYKLKII